MIREVTGTESRMEGPRGMEFRTLIWSARNGLPSGPGPMQQKYLHTRCSARGKPHASLP